MWPFPIYPRGWGQWYVDTSVRSGFSTGREKFVALFIFMVDLKLLCDVLKAELRSKVAC